MKEHSFMLLKCVVCIMCDLLIIDFSDWDVATPEHFIPWPHLVLVICACILTALTVLMIYKRFALSVVLFFKQNLSRSECGGKYIIHVNLLYSTLHKQFTYIKGYFNKFYSHF